MLRRDYNKEKKKKPVALTVVYFFLSRFFPDGDSIQKLVNVTKITQRRRIARRNPLLLFFNVQTLPVKKTASFSLMSLFHQLQPLFSNSSLTKVTLQRLLLPFMTLSFSLLLQFLMSLFYQLQLLFLHSSLTKVTLQRLLLPFLTLSFSLLLLFLGSAPVLEAKHSLFSLGRPKTASNVKNNSSLEIWNRLNP